MEENNEEEVQSYPRRIGKKMTALINKIGEKFNKEYYFTPSDAHITNLIAERVEEAKLF